MSASPSKRELNAMRKAHRAEVDEAVKVGIRGSGWTHKQGVAFRENGGLILEASWHATSPDLDADYRFDGAGKPMALDPLMWQILDIDRREQKPLSFRIFGAFTTQALRLVREIVPGMDAAKVAKAFRRFLAELDVFTLESWPSFADFVATNRFTEGSHPPAYFETHVLALIAEDRLPQARAVAEHGLAEGASHKYSYFAGEEPGTPRGKLRPFAEMALIWLDKGQKRLQ